MRRNKPIPSPEYRRLIQDWCIQEKPAHAVEVGVYSGKLSKLLQPYCGRLTLVDPWRAPYMHFDQEHMTKIGVGVRKWADTTDNVKVFHMTSEMAASMFEDEEVDFWHTDGDHSYEECKKDIELWMSKVKPGAIMSGDNLEIETVRQAVSDAFPSFTETGYGENKKLGGRIWWFRRP